VTGATGTTGRRLVPALRARGVNVRAANRTPVPAEPGIDPVRFDWSDESTFPRALAGVDAAYLVAALSEKIVAQVGSFLARAAEAGVRRIVVLSALGIDQAPAEHPLRALESVVLASGIASTILRPATFMQNFSEVNVLGLAAQIRERSEIVWAAGAVTYVSADDIAAVAAVALTEDGHEGRAYHPTGPGPLTLAEVAAEISAAAGRTIRCVESGPEAIRDALLSTGAPRQFAEGIAHTFAEGLATGLIATVTDDVARVAGRPPMSFAQFAAAAAPAWRG
jgi:uncharacterized protein YbjT (DUF2867 family)